MQTSAWLGTHHMTQANPEYRDQQNNSVKEYRTGNMTLNSKGDTTARNRPHLKAGRVGPKKTSTQIQACVQGRQAHRFKCPPSTTMWVDRPLDKGDTTAKNRPHLQAGRVGQKKTSTQIQVRVQRRIAHKFKCSTFTTMRVDQTKKQHSSRSGSSNKAAIPAEASPRTEVKGKTRPVRQAN